MNVTTLKIKPRAPQKRVIDAAKAEGTAVPIARAAFELQVPSYGIDDILKATETNNQKVLSYLARLLNQEVVNTIRSQMNDDEQFPPDQEIDTANFDLDAVKLDALSETTTKSTALDLEFDDEQFKEFATTLVSTLLPKYSTVPRAEVKLLNTANVLIGGFKDVRNEPEKMEHVKSTLDVFMSVVDEATIEKYADMYEWFQAMFEKRMKAWNKRQEKTDVTLD